MINEMGEMHTRITPMELAAEMQVSPERVGQLFRALRDGQHPHFVGRFNRFAELSHIQVAVLRGESTLVEIREEKDTESAATSAATNTMNSEQGRPKEVAPQGVSIGDKTRRWPLWVVLIATIAASAANMAEVTGAVKSGSLSAMAWTFVFASTPFFLIYARIGGFWKWFSIIGAMGYTGFCNAIALFGSMTAMDKGYILSPTIFLEAVTNFANTDYMNTARTLSALMATVIAGIEFAAFKNLSK